MKVVLTDITLIGCFNNKTFNVDCNDNDFHNETMTRSVKCFFSLHNNSTTFDTSDKDMKKYHLSNTDVMNFIYSMI